MRVLLLADRSLEGIALDIDDRCPVIRNHAIDESGGRIRHHGEIHLPFLYRTADGSLPEKYKKKLSRADLSDLPVR